MHTAQHMERDRVDVSRIVKRALVVAAVTFGLGLGGVAVADPDFGPGNSSKGPGAKCHAPDHGEGPGPHEPVPGCKGN